MESSSQLVSSSPPVVGLPQANVQGHSHFSFRRETKTLFPADLTQPTFLGATVGHGPIMMICGRCGYEGLSSTRRRKGLTNVLTAFLFFGVGYFLPVDDTHHYCPLCDHHVAVAKIT